MRVPPLQYTKRLSFINHYTFIANHTMAKLQVLLLVTFFASILLASPITQKQKRSFKVPHIRQANYVPNGRIALRKAFLKFGLDDVNFRPNGEVGTRVKAAAAASESSAAGNEDGEVSASPSQNDAEFLSPVTVGGQQLVMNFDSGSADM